MSRLYDAIMTPPEDFKPTWTHLFISFFSPFEAAYSILRKGSGPVFRYIRSHPRSLFSPSELQKQFSAATMPWYMALVDESMMDLKQSLVDEARGVVLEIGAGTGETLKYYDMDTVEKVYGVEPNLEKCAVLRGEIERLGIAEKYHVIPHGIESTKELEEHGVSLGSVDTIVAVPCLYPPTPF